MDLKYFTGVGWALANSEKVDWQKGRDAILVKYGRPTWLDIKATVKRVGGVKRLPTIQQPSGALTLFIETVAHSADHRAWKEQQTSTKKGK